MNTDIWYIGGNILLDASYSEKWFLQRLWWWSKHTFYVQYPPPDNRSAYVLMWQNLVQPYRPQMTTQYNTEQYFAEKMRFAYRIAKVIIPIHTHNNSTLTSFPRQQQQRERAAIRTLPELFNVKISCGT